ncbi:sphingomyelinase phosphodiesterase D-like [Oscarella lobularis]|uniref:sphingomyelinase phosphodiesterase D-like n=1 Tax=Oscarella lobularis TaxID=121494 RepID=UPI00331377DE
MENLDEPFLDGRRARGRSKCWHCAATIFFVLSSVALAVALALTWIEELPCTTTNQSNKTTFPSDWIRFFHVADIHYDPEYESNVTSRPTYCRANQNAVTAATTALYGRIGCDSPASLVQNAVKAMKTEDETVDFIVVTGDLSAHNLFNETVLHAIQFVTDQLRETFPTTYVFPCLGNNDVPADYYIPTPPTNWYEDVLTLWKGFILCSSCLWRSGVTPTTESSLRQTFLTGGYYRVSLSSKLTLLVLNTVYYSVTVKSQYRTPLFEKTAEGQLTWLAEQLADAEKDGKRAIIAGHVPPGINPYDLSSFWVSNATLRYVDITARQYPHVVAGQLFAHMHKDDFKVFFADQKSPSVDQSSAMLFAPAISPVYNNNPAFRLMFLDDTSQTIADYRQWYLDLAIADEFLSTHWLEEYTFSESFPSDLGSVINSQRVSSLSQQILSRAQDDTWHNYLWHRQAEYLPDSVTFSRFRLHCAIQRWNETAFDACKQKFPFISG